MSSLFFHYVVYLEIFWELSIRVRFLTSRYLSFATMSQLVYEILWVYRSTIINTYDIAIPILFSKSENVILSISSKWSFRVNTQSRSLNAFIYICMIPQTDLKVKKKSITHFGNTFSLSLLPKVFLLWLSIAFFNLLRGLNLISSLG